MIRFLIKDISLVIVLMVASNWRCTCSDVVSGAVLMTRSMVTTSNLIMRAILIRIATIRRIVRVNSSRLGG